MLDCSITENYLKEKGRMTDECICCGSCPFNLSNNKRGISCARFEVRFTYQSIQIVQKWSDEHPLKTNLTEVLKAFPNTDLSMNSENPGCPDFCPSNLGLKDTGRDNCSIDCSECWNMPIKE